MERLRNPGMPFPHSVFALWGYEGGHQAQTGDRRLPDFPDLPTFKEQGFPDLVSTTWFSLCGPAGLPADIVQKVNREIAKTMARPEIERRLREEGMLTQALSPAEFRQLIESETVRWKPVLERAGLIEK
jgi:tripartite-type tricarboxylate transporter receptor subunit TctC